MHMKKIALLLSLWGVACGGAFAQGPKNIGAQPNQAQPSTLKEVKDNLPDLDGAAQASLVTEIVEPVVNFVADFDPWFTLDRVNPLPPLPGDTIDFSCPSELNVVSPLGLSDAVDLALCNKASIRMAFADIKLQAAGLGQATGAFFPTLSVSMANVNSRSAPALDGLPATSVKRSSVNAAFNWRIFDFGARFAQYSSSNNLLLAAMYAQNAEVQRVISEVIQSYFGAIAARSSWDAKKSARKIADNTVLVTKHRAEKGAVASNSDVLQAAAAASKAVLEEVRALGAYQKSVAVLVQSMGVPSSSTIVLPEKMGDGGAQDVAELERLMKEVSATHPSILAAKAKVIAARDKASSTGAGSLPTVDFNVNMYKNGRIGQAVSLDDSTEVTTGLTLTIPLFEGLSSIYKMREALADVDRKKAELHDMEQNVLVELVKTHADAQSALNNLEASKSLIDVSNSALASVMRRYEKGAADIIEMLNAQRSSADAEQERVTSISEWWSARLRLLASVGKIGRSSISALKP